MPQRRSIASTPTLRTSLRITPPFRLDFTVMALRRLPQNRVEILDGARYLRAFDTPRGNVVWEITQTGDRLEMALHGPVDDAAPYRDLAARMLGTEVDLASFYSRARRIRGLSPLARRFSGLKPPRFSSLWETILNAIPFQQLSLVSALASLGRLIEGTSQPVDFEGQRLYPLPRPERLAGMSEAELKGFGFSGAKARALRDAAIGIASGSITEEDLEPLSTEALAERLTELRGIGPWTASLMMLRGFRRLDVFPAGDAGAARGLRETFPDADPEELLHALGPYRGMLYYHLLLARGAQA